MTSTSFLVRSLALIISSLSKSQLFSIDGKHLATLMLEYRKELLCDCIW